MYFVSDKQTSFGSLFLPHIHKKNKKIKKVDFISHNYGGGIWTHNSWNCNLTPCNFCLISCNLNSSLQDINFQLQVQIERYKQQLFLVFYFLAETSFLTSPCMHGPTYCWWASSQDLGQYLPFCMYCMTSPTSNACFKPDYNYLLLCTSVLVAEMQSDNWTLVSKCLIMNSWYSIP